MMNVYAVIINWNGWRDTIMCVDSLIALNSPHLKIIIVDNASSDDSISQLKDYLARKPGKIKWRIIDDNFNDNSEVKDVAIIQSKYNRGFSGGNNLGLRLALKDGNAAYFWILNNDTVVEKESLNELIKKMEWDKDIGICGSRLIYFHNRNLVQAYGGCRYNRWLSNTYMIGNMAGADDRVDEERISRELDYVIGASMFISRRFVEEIGMMDERFFLYREDYDWAKRAWGRFTLAYCDRSVVYHKEGATIGGSNFAVKSKSLIADYFYLRNKLVITKKYFPYAYPVVVLGMCGAIIKRILRRQYGRIWLIIKIIFYSIFKKDKIFIKVL
jgi:hypothetical protein